MNTSATLQRDVEEELHWDPSVHAERIGVTVKDEVVQLDGHVESLYEKWAAERAALRVHNVKAVANEIQVEPPISDQRTDAEIAQAALTHLEWNYIVPATVKVKVSNGWVTFEGLVTAQYQKDEAERVLRSLRGVRGIVNEIAVESAVNVDIVKNKIVHALKRSAIVNARDVHIETSGGTVTLRGYVHSWTEREEVERAAWAAPGVTRVNDLLAIVRP